jgi:two-component system cell cycle sensor histidine kinase/response regulator CckA
LTAIIGYGDIALADLSTHEDDSPRECVQEMVRAGNRAAELTGQLLAFSRKQVLQPRVLHLNDVVSDYEPMLTRLLGDDVVVHLALDPELAAVKADPGQVGQVVMNLAVNARDAMANGGELTISTRNAELDEPAAPVGLEPGAYAVLSVTDTGTGIDAETRERIFEPFFTTKAQGEGTGLGLATVLGVVQQSGGQITVYSEPGQGTTFNVYLPQTDELRRDASGVADAVPRPGTERVLLVEDNDVVRGLLHQMCESLGYELITAARPSEAVALCDSFEGTIDLLLTDVMMPEMNGRELADQLLSRRPGLRVLFTSGFTGDAMMLQGVLDSEAAFLQKPFTRKQLARSARELLDAA